MDYVQKLKLEASEAHSIFHQYALAISGAKAPERFFFFEGEEDPSFYMQHIAPRIAGTSYELLICNGRASVLKTYELIKIDGRGAGRTFFFIDKDHNDILEKKPRNFPPAIFETQFYSIENYLVSEPVFLRYWSERLRLPTTDERYSGYIETLTSLLNDFYNRSRLLTAIILLGRGIDGHPQAKLNLNNAQLDKIFQLDLQTGKCKFRKGALKHFLSSTTSGDSFEKISIFAIRNVYHQHLAHVNPKIYTRGKYEIWVFYKFISYVARQLTDREKSKAAGLKRASPLGHFSQEMCVTNLCSLVACPIELRDYLNNELAA